LPISKSESALLGFETLRRLESPAKSEAAVWSGAGFTTLWIGIEASSSLPLPTPRPISTPSQEEPFSKETPKPQYSKQIGHTILHQASHPSQPRAQNPSRALDSFNHCGGPFLLLRYSYLAPNAIQLVCTRRYRATVSSTTQAQSLNPTHELSHPL